MEINAIQLAGFQSLARNCAMQLLCSAASNLIQSYLHTNVIQQSSGSQTPELQGDADRVLVRFQ